MKKAITTAILKATVLGILVLGFPFWDTLKWYGSFWGGVFRRML